VGEENRAREDDRTVRMRTTELCARGRQPCAPSPEVIYPFQVQRGLLELSVDHAPSSFCFTPLHDQVSFYAPLLASMFTSFHHFTNDGTARARRTTEPARARRTTELCARGRQNRARENYGTMRARMTEPCARGRQPCAPSPEVIYPFLVQRGLSELSVDHAPSSFCFHASSRPGVLLCTFTHFHVHFIPSFHQRRHRARGEDDGTRAREEDNGTARARRTTEPRT
jgi:hypothetical protein